MTVIKTKSGSVYELDEIGGYKVVSGAKIGKNVPYEDIKYCDDCLCITLCNGRIVKTSPVMSSIKNHHNTVKEMLVSYSKWLAKETHFEENNRTYVVRYGNMYDAIELFLYEARI